MKFTKAKWYLVLVLVQAAHSIEEYFGHLWEVFPPARWLTGLFSSNRHDAFLIINIGLFIFGILTWYFLVRPDGKLANAFIWFMVVLEVTNGIIHIGWSLKQESYTPGVITAPLLFIVAFYLMRSYLKRNLLSIP